MVRDFNELNARSYESILRECVQYTVFEKVLVLKSSYIELYTYSIKLKKKHGQLDIRKSRVGLATDATSDDILVKA